MRNFLTLSQIFLSYKRILSVFLSNQVSNNNQTFYVNTSFRYRTIKVQQRIHHSYSLSMTFLTYRIVLSKVNNYSYGYRIFKTTFKWNSSKKWNYLKFFKFKPYLSSHRCQMSKQGEVILGIVVHCAHRQTSYWYFNSFRIIF